MDYMSLRVKSSYSLLSSLIDIDKLVEISLSYGYKTIAISDINCMYGVMSFYKRCINCGIKPIIGVEFTYKDSIIILYAKNLNGYKNLVKLTTIKSQKNLSFDDLEQHRMDLVLVVLYENQYLYDELKVLYDDLYIGYSNIEDRINIFSKRIYINNVVALYYEDLKYLEYLYKIKDSKDIHDIVTIDNNHILTKDDFFNIVDDEDIHNLDELISLCNVEFEKYELNLPDYTTNDSYDYLVSLCLKGLNKRLNNSVGVNYIDRLKYELEIIEKMGFSNYFLVVFDFVAYAKKNNILVGPGRGSAAGSLVSYVLGITNVDPIKYDLYFERFLNPNRISLPDIDIDFDSNKRDLVIDYVREKYGVKSVCEIITFGTLAPRQVIRDVGKILELTTSKLDEISQMIDSNLSLMKNYQTNTNFYKLINSTSTYKKLFDISIHLESLPRHSSIHAAGIVICGGNMDDIIPLKYENNNYLTGYTSEYLEDLGLLKMDFLALKNLSMIDEIIANVCKYEGVNINLNDINYNDDKVIDVFNKINTLGIFQFESVGMKNFLRKLKIDNFDEVIAALALYRPGPMGNIDTFIARKKGEEKVSYQTKELEPILKSTYGIIIYQEQIMQIANVLAGFDLADADVLRKAMSKKQEDLILGSKEKFINGCINNGHTINVANSVFDLILKFAAYGFNKAHSVSYGMVAYWMAYLKCYYPKYFYASLFTLVQSSPLKLKQAIVEARNYGINILHPNINCSKFIFEAEKNGIRFSLTCIKGLGGSNINTILENQPYDSFIEFVVKNSNKTKNKKIIENLIFAGCFDIFGYNKKTLIENLDNIINYAHIISQLTLGLVQEPEIIIYQEYEKELLMKKEQELFGFYLTMHPVNKYKTNDDLNVCDLENYFDKYVSIIVYIDTVKIIDTKNGTKMAFLTLSDDTSLIDGVMFSTTLSKYNNFNKGNVVAIRAKVEKRMDSYQLICNELKVLE